MAKRSPKAGVTETTHYQHDGSTRKNIPSAAMEAEGTVPKAKRVKYAYSPHLAPVLRFDPTGRADRVAEVVEKACKGERLSAQEQEILRAVGQNWDQPWLEWAGKQEEHARGHFSVDPVALHIHERVSAQAILRNAMREDVQASLFGSREQTYAEALQFYKHDVDWANRLILGDSLQVMSSLAQREGLAGKVQMIYVDPPYGIKFASNFQPAVDNRSPVDGSDDDLTREPEMVKAFRDTWHLGVSSYLSYLQERLRSASELLTSSGSLFLQISDDNVARVRLLAESVFGAENYCGTISVRKTSGQTPTLLSRVSDSILWFAKDKPQVKFRRIFEGKSPIPDPTERYVCELTPDGELVDLTVAQKSDPATASGKTIVRLGNPTSQTGSASTRQAFAFYGRSVRPAGARGWSTNIEGLKRLARAERLALVGKTLRWINHFTDYPVAEVTLQWDELTGSGFGETKLYSVQTQPSVVARCLLMTTDPGDLVLDPTCGSGTTAVVAEHWGRRWIAIDTSRVAMAIARQRLLTARLPHYRTQGGASESSSFENPASGFRYERVSHVTLKSIAQNVALDAVCERHEATVSQSLKELNYVLANVPAELRARLKAKFDAKVQSEGAHSVDERSRRRWLLPPENRNSSGGWLVDQGFNGWYDWEVPFDVDPEWPRPLVDALLQYRIAWRAKMGDINRCIADNAEQEELVDRPEVVKGVVRVSGPFTVEGVIPEDLSLGEDGTFDPTPNEFDSDDDVATDTQNLSAYLSRMLAHLKADGLTFLNNQRKQFERLESLIEDGSGSFLHAEGEWKEDPNSLVAVTFGPQYGPVTALQVEEAIRASKRYTDLVIAGFSFDAETYAIVEQQQHPKLRVHLAQIRPDLNESMDGLLKNTPNSQLFTVFGQPDIEVKQTDEGYVCTLLGVDIYNPTDNTLRSSGADKVAAWFLDSDYDGRCFCATQAFFPDRNAWEKIAKALGSQANAELFEAFNGTVSIPFERGKHARIAVKVIDPRGNEVMAIRRLS